MEETFKLIGLIPCNSGTFCLGPCGCCELGPREWFLRGRGRVSQLMLESDFFPYEHGFVAEYGAEVVKESVLSFLVPDG